MFNVSSFILNHLPSDSQHRRQNNRPDDATAGLRILARMIAQAYLRNSLFKGKAGNKRRERKNK